jgi:hypothetical protein
MQDITPASTVNTAEYKFALLQRFMYRMLNNYFLAWKKSSRYIENKLTSN